MENTEQFICFSAEKPVNFKDAGQFVLTDRWIHTVSELKKNEYGIIWMLSGEMHLLINDEFTLLKKGDLLTLPPGTTYRGYEVETTDLSFYWCYFSSKEVLLEGTLGQLGELSSESTLMLPKRFQLDDSSRNYIPINQLIDYCHRSDISALHLDYLMTSFLFEISDKIKNTYFKKKPLNHRTRNISMIQQWIKVNCHNQITLSNCAEHFNYNKSYLSRIFKEQTGTTITNFINDQRITNAKNLLLTTSYTIEEIVYLCGFNDKSHFYKVFRRAEKITPKSFRNTYSTLALNND